MVGLSRGRVLLMTAAAIIVVTALTPSSSIHFRDQVDTVRGQWVPEISSLNGGPIYGQAKWVKDVYPLVFRGFGQPEGIAQPASQLEQLRRWAESEGSRDSRMWATVARHASNGLANYFFPKRSGSESTRESTRFRIWTLGYASRKGEELDPKNAFFPLMGACALWLQGNREAASDALQRAAACTEYEDYADFEFLRHSEIAEDIGGPLSAEIRTFLWADVRLPHVAMFRGVSLGRAIREQGTDEDRVAAIKVARVMIRECDRIIDGLVAASLVNGILGVEPTTMNIVERDAAVRQSAAAYAAKIGRLEIIEAVDEVRATQKKLIPDWSFGNQEWDAAIMPSIVSRRAGAAILVALLVLMGSALVSLKFRAMGNAPLSGALPHLVAAGTWIYLVTVFPQRSTENFDGTLYIMSFAHVALAFMYASQLAAKLAVATYVGVILFILYFRVDPLFKEPALYASLLLVPLSLKAQHVRARWSSRAGFAMSLVTAFMSMLSFLALIPAIGYVFTWFICRSKVFQKPLASTILLLAGCIGAGILNVTIVSVRPTEIYPTIVIATIALGLILRPLARPGRVGAVALVLSILYIANMGRVLVAAQKLDFATEKVRTEAETLRASPST